jgi:hypothetical protein
MVRSTNAPAAPGAPRGRALPDRRDATRTPAWARRRAGLEAPEGTSRPVPVRTGRHGPVRRPARTGRPATGRPGASALTQKRSPSRTVRYRRAWHSRTRLPPKRSAAVTRRTLGAAAKRLDVASRTCRTSPRTPRQAGTTPRFVPHVVPHESQRQSRDKHSCWSDVEPEVGIEPTTYRLQGGCSTTELHRPVPGAILVAPSWAAPTLGAMPQSIAAAVGGARAGGPG